MTEELHGLIFDIQGYSVHDGPGCRTLVFMKGCPLRCEWCSNPEGMRTAQDIMFRDSKCVYQKNSCRRCLDVCPHQAIQVNPKFGQPGEPQLVIDRSQCRGCLDQVCLKVCYFEGLRACGEWKSVNDLMHVFQRNRPYWGNSGGVTFSGGEPLLQAKFVQAVLQACRDEHIHTAVETTAYCRSDTFLDVLSLVDFAFIDVKHMLPDSHAAKTGVSNQLIHENLSKLAKSGWKGRLVLRMPVIPGYNDTPENISATAAFMRQLGLVEINLLPFHRLGDSKWSQLGKMYAYHEQSSLSEDRLSALQDQFLGQRIACYIGSDTPF